MIYQIYRSSEPLNPTNPPCKGAKKKKTESGCIYYYIRIDSLEELNKLIEEVGHIIISPFNEIEIYDACRE